MLHFYEFNLYKIHFICSPCSFIISQLENWVNNKFFCSLFNSFSFCAIKTHTLSIPKLLILQNKKRFHHFLYVFTVRVIESDIVGRLRKSHQTGHELTEWPNGRKKRKKKKNERETSSWPFFFHHNFILFIFSPGQPITPCTYIKYTSETKAHLSSPHTHTILFFFVEEIKLNSRLDKRVNSKNDLTETKNAMINPQIDFSWFDWSRTEKKKKMTLN